MDFVPRDALLNVDIIGDYVSASNPVLKDTPVISVVTHNIVSNMSLWCIFQSQTCTAAGCLVCSQIKGATMAQQTRGKRKTRSGRRRNHMQSIGEKIEDTAAPGACFSHAFNSMVGTDSFFSGQQMRTNCSTAIMYPRKISIMGTNSVPNILITFYGIMNMYARNMPIDNIMRYNGLMKTSYIGHCVVQTLTRDFVLAHTARPDTLPHVNILRRFPSLHMAGYDVSGGTHYFEALTNNHLCSISSAITIQSYENSRKSLMALAVPPGVDARKWILVTTAHLDLAILLQTGTCRSIENVMLSREKSMRLMQRSRRVDSTSRVCSVIGRLRGMLERIAYLSRSYPFTDDSPTTFNREKPEFVEAVALVRRIVEEHLTDYYSLSGEICNRLLDSIINSEDPLQIFVDASLPTPSQSMESLRMTRSLCNTARSVGQVYKVPKQSVIRKTVATIQSGEAAIHRTTRSTSSVRRNRISSLFKYNFQSTPMSLE